jgi:biotin carboxyl carrier protein
MGQKYLVHLGDEVKEIEVEEGPQGLRVCLNGQWHGVRLEQVGQSSLYALLVDGRPHELFALERAGGFDIVIGSRRFPVAVGTRERRPTPPLPLQPLQERPAEAGGWLVLSPMTGAVVSIYVGVGDAVVTGDVLMLIEAMKMNNELRAQRAGTIREVYVSRGQRVEQGSPLLLLA